MKHGKHSDRMSNYDKHDSKQEAKVVMKKQIAGLLFMSTV